MGNAGSIVWHSKAYLKNGLPRVLFDNNEFDKIDKRISVSQGERRKLYIDGHDNQYLSGDRSRINLLTNAYNSQINFTTRWKTAITNLSIRLRSRVDEVSPNTNRFGGYVLVVRSGNIQFYKQNFLGNYTTLTSTIASSPTLADGELVKIKFMCYDTNNHTNVTVRCFMARPDQFNEIHFFADTTPGSHVLDKLLYQRTSYSHIKLNGTAKDVWISNIRVFSLPDDYVYQGDESAGDDPII